MFAWNSNFVSMCLDYVTIFVDIIVYPVTDGAVTLNNKCCSFVNTSATASIISWKFKQLVWLSNVCNTIFPIGRSNKNWYTDYTYSCVSISQIYNSVNIWAMASIKNSKYREFSTYVTIVTKMFARTLNFCQFELFYFQYSLNLASDMERSYANHPWKKYIILTTKMIPSQRYDKFSLMYSLINETVTFYMMTLKWWQIWSLNFMCRCVCIFQQLRKTMHLLGWMWYACLVYT